VLSHVLAIIFPASETCVWTAGVSVADVIVATGGVVDSTADGAIANLQHFYLSLSHGNPRTINSKVDY